MSSSAGDEKREVSRRGFLQGTASAALVASVGGGLGGCKPTEPTATAAPKQRPKKKQQPKKQQRRGASRSRVVLIRDEGVLDAKGQPRARVLSQLLDRAVAALLGQKSAAAAWKELLGPADRLGIKSNAWSYLATPPALEQAIQRRARQVGIPAKRIVVDDRGARETLKDCTALINARPLRSHHWAGVGGCLKNYIMFVERPYLYHPDSCADLGAVWNLPIVKGKTRLNVLVMLTPLYHGRGPHHYSAKYIWPYGGLLVSRDPVAADAVGVAILKAKRREAFGGERPFTTNTKHIEVADKKHGVGVSDLKRIDLVKLGYRKGILI